MNMMNKLYTVLFLTCASLSGHAQKAWIDVTDAYMVNPRFDNNDLVTGWEGTGFIKVVFPTCLEPTMTMAFIVLEIMKVTSTPVFMHVQARTIMIHPLHWHRRVPRINRLEVALVW